MPIHSGYKQQIQNPKCSVDRTSTVFPVQFVEESATMEVTATRLCHANRVVPAEDAQTWVSAFPGDHGARLRSTTLSTSHSDTFPSVPRLIPAELADRTLYSPDRGPELPHSCRPDQPALCEYQHAALIRIWLPRAALHTLPANQLNEARHPFENWQKGPHLNPPDE